MRQDSREYQFQRMRNDTVWCHVSIVLRHRRGAKTRRGPAWVRSDQDMFRTGLELRVTSIMENDNSYKDNYYT